MEARAETQRTEDDDGKEYWEESVGSAGEDLEE